MSDVYNDIPQHLEALLADVTENQKRLHFDMHDGMAGSPGAGCNPKHVAIAATITKLSVDLSRELRAWSKTVKDRGRQLSIGERINLTVAFVRSLSDADRRDFDRILAEGISDV